MARATRTPLRSAHYSHPRIPARAQGKVERPPGASGCGCPTSSATSPVRCGGRLQRCRSLGRSQARSGPPSPPWGAVPAPAMPVAPTVPLLPRSGSFDARPATLVASCDWHSRFPPLLRNVARLLRPHRCYSGWRPPLPFRFSRLGSWRGHRRPPRRARSVRRCVCESKPCGIGRSPRITRARRIRSTKATTFAALPRKWKGRTS